MITEKYFCSYISAFCILIYDKIWQLYIYWHVEKVTALILIPSRFELHDATKYFSSIYKCI